MIDIGCGNGRDSVFFASHGVSVISIDRCPAAIERITSRPGIADMNISALVASVADPTLLARVERLVEGIGASGLGVIYARFFIHAITAQEQGAFLDFCGAFLNRHGARLALEFRTPMDEALTKVTAPHYRRYVDPAGFLAALRRRGLDAYYMVEGTGYAKYEDDDAHVVRMLIDRPVGAPT